MSTFGVPQGSNLRFSLFFLCINDIHSNDNFFKNKFYHYCFILQNTFTIGDMRINCLCIKCDIDSPAFGLLRYFTRNWRWFSNFNTIKLSNINFLMVIKLHLLDHQSIRSPCIANLWNKNKLILLLLLSQKTYLF